MDDLNDLYFYVQVVDHRGFAPAARTLGIPKSRLSRRIGALETRLGVRLIQRSSRRFAVTDIGQEYYRHCLAVVIEARAAQEAVERSRAAPQGLIRVSCPPALVCFGIGPLISRFLVANPKVSVELDSTSRRVDVIGEAIDVAIRVRFPPFEEEELVRRVLGRSAQRLVAAPALIAHLDRAIVPADLAHLPSLAVGPMQHAHAWLLTGQDGAAMRVPHSPRLVTDDMPQLLDAALRGVGVAQLPTIVIGSHVDGGRLADLLPGWSLPEGEVQAVFASRRGLLPSVRGFIDFLAANYGEPAPVAGHGAALPGREA